MVMVHIICMYIDHLLSASLSGSLSLVLFLSLAPASGIRASQSVRHPSFQLEGTSFSADDSGGSAVRHLTLELLATLDRSSRSSMVIFMPVLTLIRSNGTGVVSHLPLPTCEIPPDFAALAFEICGVLPLP